GAECTREGGSAPRTGRTALARSNGPHGGVRRSGPDPLTEMRRKLSISPHQPDWSSHPQALWPPATVPRSGLTVHPDGAMTAGSMVTGVRAGNTVTNIGR